MKWNTNCVIGTMLWSLYPMYMLLTHLSHILSPLTDNYTEWIYKLRCLLLRCLYTICNKQNNLCMFDVLYKYLLYLLYIFFYYSSTTVDRFVWLFGYLFVWPLVSIVSECRKLLLLLMMMMMMMAVVKRWWREWIVFTFTLENVITKFETP